MISMISKVAVLLPVYRGDTVDGFNRAVESLLNQTYTDFTVVVCQDGPIDSIIEKKIDSLVEDSMQFITLKSKKNKGLPSALNMGIKGFDADIYFRMDADDESTHDRFEIQLKALNKDKTLLALGSHIIRIDEFGNRYAGRKLPLKYVDLVSYTYKRCPMVHASIVFRKEFFEKVGLYNESFIGGMEDYDLLARAIACNVNMKNLEDVLYYFYADSTLTARRINWNNIKNDIKLSYHLIKKRKAYNKIPIVSFKIIVKVGFKILPGSVHNYFKKNVIR